MKDWSGNSNSIYKTLGASNHTDKERETNDYYATDSIAIDKLLEVEALCHFIWEPAAGEGHLAERLKKHDFHVVTSDIVERNYKLDAKMDFLKVEGKWGYDILTNPPYKCFSADTEILTQNGWKKYTELDINIDQVLSVNINTKQLTWSKIQNIIEKDIDDDIIHFKQKFLDIKVTKDHRMFAFSTQNNKPQMKNGDVYLAKDIKQTSYIPTSGYIWNGKTVNTFTLDGCFVSNGSRDIWNESKEIDIVYWIRFLGFWLADGCCRHTINNSGNNRYTVSIKQNIYNENLVRQILDNLPFSYKVYKNKNDTMNFEIHNKQLWLYLSQFGKAKDKFVPKDIKELNKDLLHEFLKYYMLGDSTSHQSKNGKSYILSSVSKQLIEDIQEIILKLGYLVNIRTYNYTKSKLYLVNFCINKSTQNRLYYCNTKNPVKYERYKGKVFCLNIFENHFFVLRRNNKIFISGNCAKEFVLKALDLVDEGHKVYMFLKLTFLEGKARYKELFSKYPPKVIYVFSERVMCAKNGDFEKMKAGGGSAVAYAWFVWQKGYHGDTIIKWI